VSDAPDFEDDQEGENEDEAFVKQACVAGFVVSIACLFSARVKLHGHKHGARCTLEYRRALSLVRRRMQQILFLSETKTKMRSLESWIKPCDNNSQK
jgi:hypothetical protein